MVPLVAGVTTDHLFTLQQSALAEYSHRLISSFVSVYVLLCFFEGMASTSLKSSRRTGGLSFAAHQKTVPQELVYNKLPVQMLQRICTDIFVALTIRSNTESAGSGYLLCLDVVG